MFKQLLLFMALLAGFVAGCGGDDPKPTATETCTNGLDDDGNGLVDCADPACATAPTCLTSSTKDFTAFAFLDAPNAALGMDVTATINGGAIAATLPAGTDATALVATFASTGAIVVVGGVTQESGVTPHDFTNPVTYFVTAADGSTKTYVVTVAIAASSAKDLTTFSFLDGPNAALSADVTATINGTAISATVPAGTSVGALVATFATTGASVAVGTTAQVSGTTANNFASPVTYVVTAGDGTTKSYTVTVAVAASSAKDLTAFAFLDAPNIALSADVTATITGTAITATVPTGTNVGALVATFATTGASVAVGGTAQASGITANDFGTPVTYVVTAGDGSTKSYTVTVAIAPSTAKDITSFSFLDAPNAALSADVTATIAGTAIAATVPTGTSVGALVASFATTGASVAVGATAQASGITANNFASPVSYVVTAGDGSTKTYTVTVTIAPSSAKDLMSFAFLDAPNAALSADVTATITGTAIAATVPAGTNVGALVATFTSSGASVAVGGTPQVSGSTANNFAAPVTYVVTAADSSTKTYTMTVTVAAAPTTIPDGTYTWNTWICSDGTTTIDIKAFAMSVANIMAVDNTFTGGTGNVDVIFSATCTRSTALTSVSYPMPMQIQYSGASSFTCSSTCAPSQCTAGSQAVVTDTFNFTTIAGGYAFNRVITSFPVFTLQQAAGCMVGWTESGTDTKI